MSLSSPHPGACDTRGSWQLCDTVDGRWMAEWNGWTQDKWRNRKMHRKLGKWVEGWLGG